MNKMRFKILSGTFIMLLGVMLSADSVRPADKDPINVQAMKLYEKNYDALVENSTNSQTPGYKQKYVISIYEGQQVKYEFRTRFDPGAPIETGQPMDIALESKGFFVFELPDGSQVYSRDGRLKLSPDLFLVSMAGNYKILSENGPIQIPAQSPIQISRLGEILATDVSLGKLLVLDFDQKDELERLSGSFFRLADGSKTEAKPVADYKILSGYIEASNVNIIQNMVDLPTNSKKYDANAKALQTLGKLRQSSAEIGKP